MLYIKGAGDDGQVIVDSIDGGGAKGSFNFTATNIRGQNKKQISDGKFDVKFE